MTEPVEDDLFEAVERLAELRSAGRAGVGVDRFVMPLCSSAFMSLMVEENASGGTAGGVAVERQHVIAPRRAIAEHENLAPAFGAQVDEVVAGAAQKAGEIEIARLERASRLARRCLVFVACPVDT